MRRDRGHARARREPRSTRLTMRRARDTRARANARTRRARGRSCAGARCSRRPPTPRWRCLGAATAIADAGRVADALPDLAVDLDPRRHRRDPAQHRRRARARPSARAPGRHRPPVPRDPPLTPRLCARRAMVRRRAGEGLRDPDPLARGIALDDEVRVGRVAALRDDEAPVERGPAHPIVGVPDPTPTSRRQVRRARRGPGTSGTGMPRDTYGEPTRAHADLGDVAQACGRIPLDAEGVGDVLTVGPRLHEPSRRERHRRHVGPEPGEPIRRLVRRGARSTSPALARRHHSRTLASGGSHAEQPVWRWPRAAAGSSTSSSTAARNRSRFGQRAAPPRSRWRRGARSGHVPSSPRPASASPTRRRRARTTRRARRGRDRSSSLERSASITSVHEPILRRCGSRDRPSSGRGAAACTASPSAGAAARRRSRSPSGTCSARGVAAEREQLALELGTGVGDVDRLHDGVHALTHLRVGDAEHRGVHHLRVGDEEVLGLLRVDVHAARHDHEVAAVGEVEVALVVEVPDVADRRPPVVSRVLAVFSASLWYSKSIVRSPGSNHTTPGSPDGSSSPSSSRMWIVVKNGLADRAGMREPLLARDHRGAHALGRRVVLEDDRAPPLDHPALDLDRARRRGVDRDLQRRHVVLGAHLLGQLEHPHEHRRHELRVRDPVPLDRREARLGIEVLEHDRSAAEAVDRDAELQRCRVVQRRGREVDGVARRCRTVASNPASAGSGCRPACARAGTGSPWGDPSSPTSTSSRDPRAPRRAARPGTRRSPPRSDSYPSRLPPTTSRVSTAPGSRSAHSFATSASPTEVTNAVASQLSTMYATSSALKW